MAVAGLDLFFFVHVQLLLSGWLHSLSLLFSHSVGQGWPAVFSAECSEAVARAKA